MKILNNIFKESAPVTSQNKSVKAEVPAQEPVTQNKLANESSLNLEFTSEEDMIKAVFEAENKEMSKEDLKTVQKFIKEEEGTLTEKLETLKIALQKNIPLTSKHLKQVHLAMNTSWPEGIKEHLISKAPETQEADSKEEVFQRKSFQAAEKVLFESLKENQVVTLFSGDEVSKDKVSEDEKLPEKFVQVSKEVVDKEMTSEMPLDFEETEATFTQPLEEIIQVLSEMMPEPSVNVLKFIEVKVTKEMAQAKETFDILQKNMHNKLETLTPKNIIVEGKEVLLGVIDKLDHILMKSDITLYTDMTTERELLTSSSLLDKARVLIKDQPEKAFKIIQSVKETIDGIVFKPSKEKMFGVVQKQFEHEVDLNKDKYYGLQLKSDIGLSPRSVLETLRGMGLNHEVEVSEILNKNDKSAFKSVENMKSILMKLESSSEEKVVKALDHITGQQLVNKLEVKSQKQHLMFHMPVETPTEIKDMKVHVNGQKNHQKMDWQNSRLYFVVHLDQIGDTGILVEVQGGKLSMTIKNDFEGLEDHMSHIITESTERLKTVGFESSKVKFDRLTKKTEVVKEIANTEEGFNVII